MDKRHHWFRLWLTPGLGPATAGKLLETLGSVEQITNSSPQTLETQGLKPEQIEFLLGDTSQDQLEQLLEWERAPENHILTCNDPEYPDQLHNLHRPPLVLTVKGRLDILKDPQLAIIGTRNPSTPGNDNAFEFARHLARSGLTITSGLALGIDGAAHRGALAATGATIAVTGTGLDRVYPSRHQDLARDIIERGGALVSEFPLGCGIRQSNFPQRNRIISGLSLGTLVVEAAVKSGSLITARYAREQGREVFAIPGSIHNPLAKGCHQLIKQGAKLVEDANDLLEELAPQLERYIASPMEEESSDSTATSTQQPANPEHQSLLEHMGYDPVSIDTLAELTGQGVDQLASMLLILELEGWISKEAGGFYQRRPRVSQPS